MFGEDREARDVVRVPQLNRPISRASRKKSTVRREGGTVDTRVVTIIRIVGENECEALPAHRMLVALP